jgi:hypothetical protein
VDYQCLLMSLPLAFGTRLENIPAPRRYLSADGERVANADHPPITNLQSLLFDFDDTAAFCECTDLLISSDTSVAHLGGALGQETWILVSTIGDWRWLRQRCDSPWYPSVTLYRQEKPADWSIRRRPVGARESTAE